MAGLFDSLPVRSNGQRVYASWWNVIRSALVSWAGGGAIAETTFTIANNQGVAADVTGLSFAKASYRSGIVKFCSRRKTDTASSEVRAVHTLHAIYNTQADSWTLYVESVGDADGLTFSITSAGQVQYTSSNIAGSNYVGTARFRAETFAV